MEHYETINPNKLVPHPKNSFFFDDITGQQWETFKSDIQEHGILEMIIANPANNMIIAGHQRHRAALELKLPEVPVLWRRCKSEDEHIEMMISSNLKTRFGFKYSHINAIKTGRCVAEL